MANEVQHTPGPWVVDGPAFAANPNIGLWSVEGRTNVCTHCTLSDARLIAAAPEMLSIVQRVAAKNPIYAKTAEAKALIAEAQAALARTAP